MRTVLQDFNKNQEVVKPIVSIICLCYNHERFVARSLLSAILQSYPHCEIIAVDDASTDGSRAVIEKVARKYPQIRTIFLDRNYGNCKAFNMALKQARGKYIIDLAADDMLMHDRVQMGVETMEQMPDDYGVHFCDVLTIAENGEALSTHYDRRQGKLLEPVQDGNVFELVLEKYYISTPSIMIKRNVLEDIGGYNEELQFEDFDFFIRSSLRYKYAFSDAVLVKKRKVKGSLATHQRQYKNTHLVTTAMVCQNVMVHCTTERRRRALLKRVKYELKWALYSNSKKAVKLYEEILSEIAPYSWPRVWAKGRLLLPF